MIITPEDLLVEVKKALNAKTELSDSWRAQYLKVFISLETSYSNLTKPVDGTVITIYSNLLKEALKFDEAQSTEISHLLRALNSKIPESLSFDADMINKVYEIE